MAEYICREDVIEWFMPYAHVGESIDADVVISDIKGMKAADVAPVVHGRWIHYPDCGVTRCSHCGWSIEECWESKHCPECGAKMNLEEDK